MVQPQVSRPGSQGGRQKVMVWEGVPTSFPGTIKMHMCLSKVDDETKWRNCSSTFTHLPGS